MRSTNSTASIPCAISQLSRPSAGAASTAVTGVTVGIGLGNGDGVPIAEGIMVAVAVDMTVTIAVAVDAGVGLASAGTAIIAKDGSPAGAALAAPSPSSTCNVVDSCASTFAPVSPSVKASVASSESSAWNGSASEDASAGTS